MNKLTLLLLAGILFSGSAYAITKKERQITNDILVKQVTFAYGGRHCRLQIKSQIRMFFQNGRLFSAMFNNDGSGFGVQYKVDLNDQVTIPYNYVYSFVKDSPMYSERGTRFVKNMLMEFIMGHNLTYTILPEKILYNASLIGFTRAYNLAKTCDF